MKIVAGRFKFPVTIRRERGIMTKEIFKIKNKKGFVLGVAQNRKKAFFEGVVEKTIGKYGENFVFKSGNYVEVLKKNRAQELIDMKSSNKEELPVIPVILDNTEIPEKLEQPKKRGRKKKDETLND